jgi:multiple sugar transport system permease protein
VTMNMQLLMAATTACLLPLFVLFFVAQKYIIQGIVVTGVKG